MTKEKPPSRRVLFHAGLILLLILSISSNLFAQDSLGQTREGLFVGLELGTWFPDNKNKVLGQNLQKVIMRYWVEMYGR